MSIYERLESLEESWNQYESTKKILIVITLLALIGYMMYELVFIDMIDELDGKRLQIATLEKKIRRNNPKLLERKILKKKKEILALKSDIERLRTQKMALESNLAKKGYLFYNKKSFSQFLDRVLLLSLKQEILIDSIDIKDMEREYYGLLKEVKLLQIEGSGRFLPLVGYIRKLEDEELLFKTDYVNIETNGSLVEFSLKIRLLGADL